MNKPCARCGHDASEHQTEDSIGGEGKRELCMLCDGYTVIITNGHEDWEVNGYPYKRTLGKCWHRFLAPVALLALLTLAACGGAPLTAEQCDRANEFWNGRMDYFAGKLAGPPPAYKGQPPDAHLTAYAVQFLAADELRRNPLSESIFTARDVQACRAGG